MTLLYGKERIIELDRHHLLGVKLNDGEYGFTMSQIVGLFPDYFDVKTCYEDFCSILEYNKFPEVITNIHTDPVPFINLTGLVNILIYLVNQESDTLTGNEATIIVKSILKEKIKDTLGEKFERD